MKLIGSLTSPFVRKVRIVLAEKKIEYDFVVDSPWNESTQVPQFNPLGKVPVLLIDDDKPLFDSRVIVEYLDNVAPNAKLFPAPNRERTDTKRWESIADGIIEAAATIVLERRRPPDQQNEAWILRHQQKVQLGLRFMAQQLQDTYCMGNHLSLADIAVGCALGYLVFRFPDIDWRSEYGNLASLYDRLMTRPSFQDTVPTET